MTASHLHRLAFNNNRPCINAHRLRFPLFPRLILRAIFGLPSKNLNRRTASDRLNLKTMDFTSRAGGRTLDCDRAIYPLLLTDVAIINHALNKTIGELSVLHNCKFSSARATSLSATSHTVCYSNFQPLATSACYPSHLLPAFLYVRDS